MPISKRMAAQWRRQLKPLRAIDRELYGEIVELELCRWRWKFPNEPPEGWGNNEYWINGPAVLSERVHFAHCDLLNALQDPDATEAWILALADAYRQWLVCVAWAGGTFSDKLRLSTQKYEFFGQYPSVADFETDEWGDPLKKKWKSDVEPTESLSDGRLP